MSDFKCDVCGLRGGLDVISHHAASGINLCLDRDACRESGAGTPIEKAARVCDRRATEIMKDAEESADWLTRDEWSSFQGQASVLRDVAREIRTLSN